MPNRMLLVIVLMLDNMLACFLIGLVAYSYLPEFSLQVDYNYRPNESFIGHQIVAPRLTNGVVNFSKELNKIINKLITYYIANDRFAERRSNASLTIQIVAKIAGSNTEFWVL
jgi:hypothetical protein